MSVEVRGVQYPTVAAAADALGVPYSTVIYRCRSPAFPDYRRGGHNYGRWPSRSFEERLIARPLANEFEHWEFDGDLGRRVAVVDQDDGRVIRRVGWLRCMRCSRPCFSEDVSRARLCFNCGGLASEPVGPKLTTELDIRQRSPKPERPRPATTPHPRLF